MMDSNSVIVAAVSNVKALSFALGLKPDSKRVYEKLRKDNPYPKSLELIQKIAESQKDIIKVRAIQAHFNSVIDKICADVMSANKITLHEIIKESAEAQMAVLDEAPREAQQKEIREIIGVWNQKLVELGGGEVVGAIRAVK